LVAGGGLVFAATGALSTTELELNAGAATRTEGGVAVAEKGALIKPAADNVAIPAMTTDASPAIAVMQPGIVCQKETFGSIFLSLMGISLVSFL
jgi:hypothetical protein